MKLFSYQVGLGDREGDMRLDRILSVGAGGLGPAGYQLPGPVPNFGLNVGLLTVLGLLDEGLGTGGVAHILGKKRPRSSRTP